MRHLLAAALLSSALLSSALLAAPTPAHAATDAQCIDAHNNPNGAVATWCHQNGWTVNAYIVVDPSLWVRWGDYRWMRQCGSENGGPNLPCWWNFWQPPSAGWKFWYDLGGHQHLVAGVR